MFLFVLALPIFQVRLQTSIVGRSELNFRVRNGNGWTLALMSTNYCSRFLSNKTIFTVRFPRGISSRLSTVLPVVTRTGFEPMLTA